MALSKRDAEDVAAWLCDSGIKAQYLHSELNTVERAEVLQALQAGACEVLVGVNLLREGLDLPQVSMSNIYWSLYWRNRCNLYL